MRPIADNRFIVDLRFIQYGTQVPSGGQGEFINVNAGFTENEVVKRCDGNCQFIPVLRDFVSETGDATVRVFGYGGLRQGVSFVPHLVANFSVRVSRIVHFRYFRYDYRFIFVVHVVGSNYSFRHGATGSNVMSSSVCRVSHQGGDSSFRLERDVKGNVRLQAMSQTPKPSAVNEVFTFNRAFRVRQVVLRRFLQLWSRFVGGVYYLPNFQRWQFRRRETGELWECIVEQHAVRLFVSIFSSRRVAVLGANVRACTVVTWVFLRVLGRRVNFFDEGVSN